MQRASGDVKLQSGFKVLEIHPDACQRFFPAVATLTLPLIDDSDNTVRQEAAKVLAKLVVQNKASTDLPIVVDRIPSHRRAVFDDELKKISKDPLSTTASPSPGIIPELRSVPTPLSPPGRRTSPLKQRLHAVPVESPPKAQESAPLKSSTPPLAQGISPASPADINPTGSPSETPLMKKMAEEIRNLRFKASCQPSCQTLNSCLTLLAHADMFAFIFGPGTGQAT